MSVGLLGSGRLSMFRRHMKVPVMFVHGMCCNGDIWQGFRAVFEAHGTRVYTPTLRPELRVNVHQKPRRALSELRFSDYLADLEAEAQRIEHETGRKPAVVGHSMGGLLAQALAERDCVSAAVFMSPSPATGAFDFPTRMFWRVVALGHALGIAPLIIKPKRRMVDRVVFNALPEAQRAAAYDNMVFESGRAFADMKSWPIDERKIRVPVLTIAAKRDRLLPARLNRLTGRKYAAIGGEFIEYPNHGHWLYAEPGWEKTAEEIHDWLRAATLRADASGRAPKGDWDADAFETAELEAALRVRSSA
jgi:pimeloyl-ACP methyl ester carboxylesterase